MRFTTILAVISSPIWSSPSQAGKYTFDTTGSSVTFHNTASLHGIDGVAKQFNGRLDSDAGTGVLVVKTSSMTTNLGPRDKKMHEYCLEVEKFPTIDFNVSSVTGLDAINAGAAKGSVTLNGSLSIRDVSRPVSVPASFTTEGDDLTLAGQLEFKWTDFKVPDPSIFISTLYPDMSVKFSLALKGVAPPPQAPTETVPEPAPTE